MHQHAAPACTSTRPSCTGHAPHSLTISNPLCFQIGAASNKGHVGDCCRRKEYQKARFITVSPTLKKVKMWGKK